MENDPRLGNREIPEPEPLTAEAALQLLEQRFARIAKEIRARWGTREFDAYIDGLLIDDRGGRSGFPPDAAQALLALSREHSRHFPAETGGDPWRWVDPTLRRR